MGLSHLVAKTPNVVITAHTPKFEHIVKNILGPIHPTDLAAILVNMATWRANFFDAWDDSAPSRSMIISANSESEIVEEAESGMRDAVRLEFIPLNSEHHTRD